MDTTSPKISDMPLEIALDALYARANGDAIVFGVTELWPGEPVDPARQSLLSAISRRLDAEPVDWRGWKVQKWYEKGTLVFYVKLTPPEEYGNH